ncbi:hypothetical protein CPC16_003623 [Podila verticillata]|nr:hypothetical protein CPC16_003623 [Podila verticillata]KAI9236228.1 MAG: hypothetical protein BYD32DRAFT_462706 [Podila humilis]
MEETAVNQAHQYASVAEEYEEQGELVEAIDAHTAAAEKFLMATQDTQNIEVIRTLKLMNAKHLRQAKDLQRKVAKQVAADAAAAEIVRKISNSRKVDNLALTSSAAGGGGTHPGNPGRRRSSSEHQHHYHHRQGSQQHHYHRHQHSTGHSPPMELTSRELKSRSYKPTSNDLVGTVIDRAPPGTLGAGVETGSSGSYIGSSGASSNSSSAMIEESYTLIRDHVKDESDPFNKFWDAVENLVLKISSPVAFTSIPLTADDPSFGSAVLQLPSTENPPNLTSTSSTEVRTMNPGSLENPSTLSLQTGHQMPAINLPSSKEQTQKTDLQRPPTIRVDPSAMQESYFIIDSPSATGGSKHTSRHRSASESASLSPSVTSGKRADTATPFTAPTESSRNSTKTLEEYAIENQQLKLTLDRLSKRNMKLEKHIEGAMQMSVWQKDIQRSALQLIKSQDILRPSASSHLVKQSIQERAGAGGVGGIFTSTSTSTSTSTPAMTNANNAVVKPNTSDRQASEGPNYDQMTPMTMQSRLKELTEELQAMKLENAQQTALMKKYKQRWEDLKESAKKRRNAGSVSPLPPSLPPSGTGTQVDEGGGNLPQRIRSTQQGQHTGFNPYSNSSLAGNPGSPNGTLSSNSSTRPMITLARSSSASGPVLTAGGTYQRRILMENNKAGHHLGAHHVGAVGSPSLPQVPEAPSASRPMVAQGTLTDKTNRQKDNDASPN